MDNQRGWRKMGDRGVGSGVGGGRESVVDTATFNRGLTAVSGVTCRGDKLTHASGSARDGSRGGDMRGGMRSGVTSLPVLTLVLHTALSCVKTVDLFRNA